MTKKKKLYLILILSLISITIITFYISKKVEDHKGWNNIYLRFLCKSGIVKGMIETDCKINRHEDPQEKVALALRDFVFRTTLRAPTTNTILEPSHRYFFAHYTPPMSQFCGGSSMEFNFLLSEFGIPNRLYELAAPSYFEGKEGDSHVVSEAYLNNKWVLMDPTFNCHWNCSNGTNMLSLQEINDCIKQGHNLIIQEGPTKISGYALNEYYKDFKDFIYAYKMDDPSNGSTETSQWQFFDK